MGNFKLRSRFEILFVLTASLLVLPIFSPAAQFKVTRIYDGDTIQISDNKRSVKVRLVAIDAPETSKRKYEPGQPYSQEAKKYLAGLILNKTVSIINYDLDVYNRVLGVVYWEGININLQMLRSGLAEVYKGNPPKGLDLEPYWQAEKEAKAAMRQVWSLGDKYISPKEWRRMQTERQEVYDK